MSHFLSNAIDHRLNGCQAPTYQFADAIRPQQIADAATCPDDAKADAARSYFRVKQAQNSRSGEIDIR